MDEGRKDIDMKKILTLALCALLALTMSVSVFAGEAKIKGMTSVDFQEGYPLELSMDGDMTTRGSITIDSADGEYLVVELEETAQVKGLDIAWNNGHSRFYDVEVSVSTDNKNWTVAFKRGDTKVASEEKGYSALDFDKTYEAKYIKIHCWGKTDTADNVYDGAPNAWLTFWEMKVYTEDAPVTTAAPAPETTVAPAVPQTTAPATADAAVILAAVAALSAAGVTVIRKKK